MIKSPSVRRVAVCVGVFIGAVCGGLGQAGGQYAELPPFMQQQVDQGFDAAVATGDSRLINLMGGHVGAGGRIFRPGEDEAAIVFGEGRALTEAYFSAGQGGGGLGFAGGASEPAYFVEKKKAAVREMRGLVSRTLAPVEDQDGGVVSLSSADYLPCISALLGDSIASVSASSPATGDRSSDRCAVMDWLARDESDDEPIVFGFVESSDDYLFVFVDASGKEMPFAKGIARSGDGDASRSTEEASRTRVEIKLPDRIATQAAEVIEEVASELDSAVAQRRNAFAVYSSPKAAYRWTFGQVFDGVSSEYTPFRRVCPQLPRLRVAVVGVGRSEDGCRVIEVSRLLVATTPLPTQARFIADRKGVPAKLIDLDGVHAAAFIQCPLYCGDKEKWLASRPALKQVTNDDQAYLRSMLTATWSDVDAMNSQLAEEIQGATTTAMRNAIDEATVSRDLKELAVDRRKLNLTVRILTRGQGRRLVDGLVSLASGESVPFDGLREVTNDRSEVARLVTDAKVVNYLQGRLVESFLMLAVDQEGVCLCDLRSMLSLHETYAAICHRYASDDTIAKACRFAELAAWLQKAEPGTRLPSNPLFMSLPVNAAAKQKALDTLLANLAGDEQKRREEESPDEGGEGERTDANDDGFRFPGS